MGHKDAAAASTIEDMNPDDTSYLWTKDGNEYTSNDAGDGYPATAIEVYSIHRIR